MIQDKKKNSSCFLPDSRRIGSPALASFDFESEKPIPGQETKFLLSCCCSVSVRIPALVIICPTPRKPRLAPLAAPVRFQKRKKATIFDGIAFEFRKHKILIYPGSPGKLLFLVHDFLFGPVKRLPQVNAMKFSGNFFERPKIVFVLNYIPTGNV